MVKDQHEYILCSAIWYKDLPLKKIFDSNILPINCDKGVVFCGFRHPQCMYTMCAVTGLRSVTIAQDGVGEFEQGFLTSKNRFVKRDEAAKIAFQSGQIKKEKEELYSEDLW